MHYFVTMYYIVLGAAHSEDLVILACTALTEITSVTDRQTDAQAIAKMHEARNNLYCVGWCCAVHRCAVAVIR